METKEMEVVERVTLILAKIFLPSDDSMAPEKNKENSNIPREYM